MKSLDIAKDIVYLCNDEKIKFNNTKIQKLLYLFVGFCLINNIDEILNIDEKPKLWPYGPVFPNVHKKYESLKNYLGDKIISTDNEKIKNILTETVKKWGHIPAGKLSAWTHIEDSPWDILYKKGAKWNTEMDLYLIKMYFLRRVENVVEYEEVV
jgi:uncharacterized phage-associated protein